MNRWRQIGTIILIVILTFELAWLGENPWILQPEGAVAESIETPSPTPEETPSATPKPTPEPTPYIPRYTAKDRWKLAIASIYYPLESEYEVETSIVEGYFFDARAASALEAMLEAARDDGVSLYITSAWRSRAYQAELYENRVYRFQLQGYSREEAEVLGATIVARPGTSEHELGLSADLLTGEYQVLDSGFAETEAYAWLQEHCTEFGFIERYPQGKGELTGIIWEPWHYRYVGRDVAEYITENDLCLEEYLDQVGLLPD